MLLGNNLYEQTRKIKIGEAELPPILGELKKWTNDKYPINVINIVFDKIESGSDKGQPRMNLIVEDYSRMFFEKPFDSNISYEKTISERFSKLVKDFELEKEYGTGDISVVYKDFSDWSRVRASDQLLANHKKHLMSKFFDSKIWDIVQSDYSAMIVVFYNRDDDIIENDKSGNSERIKKECFRLIKQYDVSSDN
jgi:hypothetical protein